MRNRCAIVTGSTSGIGLAIARGFAKEGCHVMLNGFSDQETVKNLCDELSAYGNKVLYNPANMAVASEIETLFKDCEERLGPVDILVNNAGVQHTAPIEEFPAEQWDRILAINLTSSFHTTRLVLPSMRKRNWGRIINIASVHGLVASVHKSAYVAAKHGMVGLTKVVALETAEMNITCNAICPGWVRTPLVEKQIEDLANDTNLNLDEATMKLLMEKQPSKRFVETDQIAALAVFLCSESACNISGIALPIDGGWIAR
ncbi:3-hydroxybutyrate dehydrogenase [soil metagenome]